MTRSTHRTFRFPARLSRTGHARLETVLGLLCDLYNAGLEHRVGAYHRQRQSVSYFDQCKQITALRREEPEVSAIDVRVLRSPLNRLNKAFGAFFRRVRNGEKPGFPRYRSKRRYRGFEIDDRPQSVIKRNGNRGRVRIKGLPPIGFKIRRELPELERLQTVRVVRTARRIEVQLVYRIDVPEPIGIEQVRHPVGIDWGVASRLTLSTGETVAARKIDRSATRRLQRKLSRAKRGSNSRRKRRMTLARIWQRARERNRGQLHELARTLVSRFDAIALEDLRILNMVRSARGTKDQPGSNVRAKAGLNRSIHEQSWATLSQLLVEKAERAGRRVDFVAPHHTSQDCSGCGRRVPKKLSVRTHRCDGCGLELDRDLNAARNVSRRAYGSPPGGTEPGAAGEALSIDAERRTNGCKTLEPGDPGSARPVGPQSCTEAA
ncbi:MAG: transposase [Proteobacteria bacterium]|nr:transposase [Pseudomonadota bacterium]